MSLWRKIVDTVRESQFFDEAGKPRTDPNSKYACFFTAAWSYFRTHHGLKLSWDEYKKACLQAKAIKSDFYLLDRDKMATAAGVKAKCVEEAGAGMAARALQLVTLGRTCLFSLNGEHYESIVGAEKYVDNETGAESLRFVLEDPGAQGDQFCDYADLICYKETPGARSYSKNHKGGPRKITRLYWWA